MLSEWLKFQVFFFEIGCVIVLSHGIKKSSLYDPLKRYVGFLLLITMLRWRQMCMNDQINDTGSGEPLVLLYAHFILCYLENSIQDFIPWKLLPWKFNTGFHPVEISPCSYFSLDICMDEYVFDFLYEDLILHVRYLCFQRELELLT